MRQSRDEFEKNGGRINKKELLAKIECYGEAYTEAFPAVATNDLNLARMFCNGMSIERIIMESHSSRPTIYRAINRIREFIWFQELHDRWQPLLDYVMDHAPHFGDCNAQSLLEMLYETYSDWNLFDDEATRASLRELNGRLEGLSIPEIDSVMDLVYRVCRCHQRTGFTEGIKVGIRLGEELRA